MIGSGGELFDGSREIITSIVVRIPIERSAPKREKVRICANESQKSDSSLEYLRSGEKEAASIEATRIALVEFDTAARRSGGAGPSQRLTEPRYQLGSVPALARAASCRLVALDADGGRMLEAICAGLPTLNAVMSSSTWLVAAL